MSETNGTTPALDGASPCSVTWCIKSPCDGEHYADPGGRSWPRIKATAYDPATLAAAPTWFEVGGLEPAVVLWVVAEGTDASIDLRPAEARRLADRLLKAAEAAERVS